MLVLRVALLAASCAACALRVPCCRRAAVATGIGVALTPPEAVAAAQTLQLIKDARAQLDVVPNQIADSNWDAVRNVVKTAPLANVKSIISRYISESGESAADLVMPREDLVQALTFLDMTVCTSHSPAPKNIRVALADLCSALRARAQVYNNNFISEQNAPGARGKGVTIDRDTPMRHLRESQAALDEIIAFKP